MPRTTPAEARLQILDVIDKSVAEARGLKESLEDERTALESQDIDALDTIVVQKSAHANDLQALDQKRSFCRRDVVEPHFFVVGVGGVGKRGFR